MKLQDFHYQMIKRIYFFSYFSYSAHSYDSVRYSVWNLIRICSSDIITRDNIVLDHRSHKNMWISIVRFSSVSMIHLPTECVVYLPIIKNNLFNRKALWEYVHVCPLCSEWKIKQIFLCFFDRWILWCVATLEWIIKKKSFSTSLDRSKILKFR